MSTTVSITHEDIKDGKKFAPLGCPVALAVKRAAGCPVSVCYDFLLLGKRVNLPKVAVDFISAFDRGEPVSPIEFSLDI